MRYRKGVIEKNIEYCFPELDQKERDQIRDKFYKHFSDVLLESIKGLTYDPHKLTQRLKFTNPEILIEEFDTGNPVTLLSQHHNNWEWGCICFGLQTKHSIIAIPKELSNPYMDKYINSRRSGNNLKTVYANKLSSYYKKGDHHNNAIVVIVDQFPFIQKRAYSLDFFGKESLFHNGVAILACRSGYPVYSFDIRKKARSVYEVRCDLIHKDPSSITPLQLTELYKVHLENLIKEAPEFWLWSHRRFKNSIDY